MDQQQLSDRLEGRVADLPVGAPPLDAMRAAVRRRRSRVMVVAAAVTVAALGTGAAVWRAADPDPRPPVASETPDIDVPPAGHRYVGVGSAVIAVPDDWGTNETECGTPMEDTVVIDQGAICMALVPRPADVESVEVRPLNSDIDDFRSWTETEIDGERAYRSPVESEGGVAFGSVYVPAYVATFVAQSSSADAVAAVEQILDGIAILDEHTTVPVFNDLAFQRGPIGTSMADLYMARLEELGLAVEVAEKASPMEPGTVLATDPAVGTVVAPGDTISVTVAR